MNDADRYIWLLSHMGLVETKAKQWSFKDKPLLPYLQDYIDKELPKVGKDWIKKQRELLNQ